MCEDCKHSTVCKYKEEYQSALDLIDVSKLDQDYIQVKAYCRHFNNHYGEMYIKENIIYGEGKKITM